MQINAAQAPQWLLFLIICLLAAIACVEGCQDKEADIGCRAGANRHLLVRTEGNITLSEAEDALRGYGVNSFGPIVYMARTPTCPVAELPASAAGQLFTFCKADGDKRACQPEGKNGITTPLFQFTCINHTCIETLNIAVSACVLNKTFNVPLVSTANSDCQFSEMVAPMSDGSTPFTPEFLQPVGNSRSLIDCILGVPTGTRIFNTLSCTDGFFRMATVVPLGGKEFVPQGVPFRCVWDGRCREHEGCCEGDALFEGTLVCYLEQHGGVVLTGSSGIRRLHWGLPLLAGFLGSLLD
ncbi:unnamed protein product [Ostreobium quekettii]|uniref:Uncharacterized protein n=1 Tax=Ostreobium quekettii TaxID=121088 RepID=A0A8S1JDG8_9CHLO|nr:unnamed protein product [Ostreobium quekettii]